MSPFLDYELPSRETGGNKHRPKIVLSNAVLFKYCLGLKMPEGDISTDDAKCVPPSRAEMKVIILETSSKLQF